MVIPLFADELAADVLPNLNESIKTTKQHLNPNLDVLGVVLTKVDSRQKIAGVFEKNISRAYPLLGAVHGESNLQYAVGGGTLHELRQSRALEEYAAVAKKITKEVWKKQNNSAAA